MPNYLLSATSDSVVFAQLRRGHRQLSSHRGTSLEASRGRHSRVNAPARRAGGSPHPRGESAAQPTSSREGSPTESTNTDPIVSTSNPPQFPAKNGSAEGTDNRWNGFWSSVSPFAVLPARFGALLAVCAPRRCHPESPRLPYIHGAVEAAARSCRVDLVPLDPLGGAQRLRCAHFHEFARSQDVHQRTFYHRARWLAHAGLHSLAGRRPHRPSCVAGERPERSGCVAVVLADCAPAVTRISLTPWISRWGVRKAVRPGVGGWSRP